MTLRQRDSLFSMLNFTGCILHLVMPQKRLPWLAHLYSAARNLYQENQIIRLYPAFTCFNLRKTAANPVPLIPCILPVIPLPRQHSLQHPENNL